MGEPWTQVPMFSAPRPSTARPDGVPEGATLRGDGVWCWATLSDEKPTPRYRYRLGRWWAAGTRALFVMLNPSTADEIADDNTLRKCIAFARAWGHGSLEVVNLFAWRDTHPTNLHAAHKRGADVVGPENTRHVEAAARDADVIVCAWGRLVPKGSTRPEATIEFVRLGGGTLPLRRPIVCLGRNADRSPKHPLFLAGDTELATFARASDEPWERFLSFEEGEPVPQSIASCVFCGGYGSVRTCPGRDCCSTSCPECAGEGYLCVFDGRGLCDATATRALAAEAPTMIDGVYVALAERRGHG